MASSSLIWEGLLPKGFGAADYLIWPSLERLGELKLLSPREYIYMMVEVLVLHYNAAYSGSCIYNCVICVKNSSMLCLVAGTLFCS